MADAAHPAIAFRGIEKWYGTRDEPVHALAPTDLAVADGEFLVLLGPSGCGKTTLLRMIGGLDRADRGRDRDRRPSASGARQAAGDRRCRKLGIVFQDPNLFPWLTIEQQRRAAARS